MRRLLAPSIILAGIALLSGAALAAPRRAAPPVTTDVSPRQQTFTVAVLGDGFGEALFDGLHDSFGAEPNSAVISATHAPSGLISDSHYDWGAAVRTLLAEHRPSAAVIMLGADDVQDLHDGTATVEPGSPRWAALYGDRVAALAEQFRAAHVPLTWVGLPIVADEDTAADFAVLNEIVRDRASAAGAHYVDSWAAFVDENGHYDAVGPDQNGRVTKLRAADGSDFTHDGALKLASFVVPDLQRARDDAMRRAAVAADVVIPREPEVENDINAQIRRELGLPALGPAHRDVKGPVAVLTAPPSSPDGTLVAASIGPAPLTYAGGASLAERALVEGRPVPPKAGRIDDFSWPRP